MLGVRALALRTWAAAQRRAGVTRRRLADAGGTLPHALDIPVFGAGDLRPVWEANRWSTLPAEPAGFVLAWMASNPPFRGPNWISAQEAAIRLLHLAMRLPGPAPAVLRPAVLAHLRRITADRAYEASQDNNHALSGPAGEIAGAVLLGRAAPAAIARLARTARRLVAPCGAFSQHSATYQRMACDLLWAAGRLCARHNWPAPFLAPGQRAAAWLDRIRAPGTCRLPNLGHNDGTSLFAGHPDLSFSSRPPRPSRWSGRGFMGWRTAGGMALLRVPGSRFRPAHGDLLHLDLWHDGLNLLRDGGTGSYHPAPGETWWTEALAGPAGHNTVQFDDHPQMPRHGRFLIGPWPAGSPLPDGGWWRDRAGNRHQRRVSPDGAGWLIEDLLSGPFAAATLRWRLCPGDWRQTTDGATGPACIRIQADGPVRLALTTGWESTIYGQVDPLPCLQVGIPAGTQRIVTRIEPLGEPG